MAAMTARQPVVAADLCARRRGEEAAARPVRPLAAPEGAVGARLRLREWDLLILEQDVAVPRHPDLLGRNDEAVPFAAAPFAGGVPLPLQVDPYVVGIGIWNEQNKRS